MKKLLPSYADSGVDYEVVEEELLRQTVKRRVIDSTGTWHSLTQTRITFFDFDQLVGFASPPNGNLYPDLDRSFDMDIFIMDSVLEESKKTGLPLDLCFQNEVIRLSNKAIWTQTKINVAKALFKTKNT